MYKEKKRNYEMKSERQEPDHLDPQRNNDKEVGSILSKCDWKATGGFQFINKDQCYRHEEFSAKQYFEIYAPISIEGTV